LRISEKDWTHKVFVPKKEEVTGGWRKLNKTELCDLCHGKTAERLSANGIGGACGMHERKDKCVRVLARKSNKYKAWKI
jgi:hypothetical protein